ncbi:MAG: hypothetical protein ACT4PV_16320 [Planctomycetaceae bacterium]
MTRQTLLFLTVNRSCQVAYRDEASKQRRLGINQIYYGRKKFNRAVAILRTAERAGP